MGEGKCGVRWPKGTAGRDHEPSRCRVCRILEGEELKEPVRASGSLHTKERLFSLEGSDM